jgi:hypothetical protein
MGDESCLHREARIPRRSHPQSATSFQEGQNSTLSSFVGRSPLSVIRAIDLSSRKPGVVRCSSHLHEKERGSQLHSKDIHWLKVTLCPLHERPHPPVECHSGSTILPSFEQYPNGSHTFEHSPVVKVSSSHLYEGHPRPVEVHLGEPRAGEPASPPMHRLPCVLLQMRPGDTKPPPAPPKLDRQVHLDPPQLGDWNVELGDLVTYMGRGDKL